MERKSGKGLRDGVVSELFTIWASSRAARLRGSPHAETARVVVETWWLASAVSNRCGRAADPSYGIFEWIGHPRGQRFAA